jgi:hypothetical protein
LSELSTASPGFSGSFSTGAWANMSGETWNNFMLCTSRFSNTEEAWMRFHYQYEMFFVTGIFSCWVVF